MSAPTPPTEPAPRGAHAPISTAEPPASPAAGSSAETTHHGRHQPTKFGSRMFWSLRQRNYRLLWFGTLISQSGDWMDQTALAWLVLNLTDSPAALAVMQFCRAMPILFFTVLGGAFADRMERRRLMFFTQSASMSLAFLLAVLVSTEVIQYWMICVIAALRGVSMSFNQPTRTALIADLVPAQDLLNATALNSATMNACRIIGPAIGGVLIWQFGVAEAFYINGFSFFATLIALQMMHIPPREREGSARLLRSLVDGLAYVRTQPTILTLLIVGLVPMVLGMPYMTLLSVYARDVMHLDSRAYGWMLASTGTGAMIGALTVASLTDFRHKGVLMLGAMFGFGVMLLVFAQSRWLELSMLLLLGVGCASTTYNATNNTLLQLHTDLRYRGRVMSLMFLERGVVPLGTMFAGFGAEQWGVSIMTTIMAGGIIALALFIAWRNPDIRQLE